MAAGSRTMNTMSEGVARLVSLLGEMKMAPDADLAFLLDIEKQVLGYHQQKFAPQLPPGGGGPDPMAGGPPPGMMMAGPQPAGGADMAALLADMPRPAAVSPSVPNPDELRRITQV